MYVATDNGKISVLVRGEFSDGNRPFLERVFDSTPYSDTQFVVDLTECTYIDSMGISALVLLWRRHGARFEALIRAHGLVHRVFQICGFIATETFVNVVSKKHEGLQHG